VTPVIPSRSIRGVYYKAESLQLTGSFKLRTAYNQIAGLTPEQTERGIVTSSSGNFAQGAAYAASLRRIPATIVMMESSNPVKVQKTRQFGAKVVFCEDRFEARQEMVDRIREEEGRTEIFPYDSENAVAGNGTVGLEILDQFQRVKHVVVPVSGGGLISGVALALKSLKPDTRIWGVQPENSNATFLSFQKGEPVPIEKAETVADGLQVIRPGRITFSLIRQYVDDIITVKESAILEAVRHFALEEKLIVEPSGAVTLAAELEGKVPADNTLCILSGGNIDPRLLIDLLS